MIDKVLDGDVLIEVNAHTVNHHGDTDRHPTQNRDKGFTVFLRLLDFFDGFLFLWSALSSWFLLGTLATVVLFVGQAVFIDDDFLFSLLASSTYDTFEVVKGSDSISV